jgi:uncharacterized protein YkwD
VLGLIAGFFPVSSACGGTGKRAQAKKVAKPKKPDLGKHGSGNSNSTTTVTNGPSSKSSSSSRRKPTNATSFGNGTRSAPGLSPALPTSTPTIVGATIEEQIVALTNQDRLANGLPPLSVDDRLTAAALIQASAMAAFNDLDHVIPGEAYPTLDERLQHVGFTYAWAGENIAFNYPDAPSVETGWMNSPTHRENILCPHPTSIGVAVAYDGKGKAYFCVEFGASK